MKHSRKERFPQPTKPEARCSNPNLAGGEIGVEVISNLPYKARPLHSFGSQRIELTIPDFDQRKFGNDKESVEKYEHHNRHQLGDQEEWRIPMLRDYISNESQRE